MPSELLNSKRDLFDYFQKHIYSAYKQLLEDNKLVYDNNLLKTYLLENDLSYDISELESIKDIFIYKEGKKATSPKIREIDQSLFQLTYSDKLEVFVDASDKRIWNVYSLSNSEYFDKLISKVSYSTSFDNLWLSHSFLNSFQNVGLIRGFGLDYDYKKFSDEEVSPSLRLQLSGTTLFNEIYDALYSIESLRHQITLSKIKIKTVEDGDVSKFILQDIKYNGKITARGNDIDLHLLNIHKLKIDYYNLLNVIEDSYRLIWTKDENKVVLKGSPIYFIKEGEILDVELLANKMFDGSAPFKLLGFPKDHVNSKLVDVLDLHIGSTFTIQIFPDMIVLYLEDKVCGNTVLRLLTNLQHAYSNSFKVENNGGEIIFHA